MEERTASAGDEDKFRAELRDSYEGMRKKREEEERKKEKERKREWSR